MSTKTIEYHLRSIYRKLDIRSRTELALVLAKTTQELEESKATDSRAPR